VVLWNQLVAEGSGSNEKQEELLNELYKQMFIVAYSVMRNKFDAMDVVQESWVKILQKLDTLKDVCKIKQWAKVITYHTAINMLKKKQSLTNDAHIQGMAVVHKTTEILDVEGIVTRSAILDKMEQFDSTTRTILLYKFDYQMRDQEIADRFNMPVGTIKAKIHRAKERLKTHLQDFAWK